MCFGVIKWYNVVFGIHRVNVTATTVTAVFGEAKEKKKKSRWAGATSTGTCNQLRYYTWGYVVQQYLCD